MQTFEEFFKKIFTYPEGIPEHQRQWLKAAWEAGYESGYEKGHNDGNDVGFDRGLYYNDINE